MKKKSKWKRLADWLDVFLLLPGMGFAAAGVFLIYLPAGLITVGVCLTALAFFVAMKQSSGGDG